VFGQENTVNGEHIFPDRSFTPTLGTTYAFSFYAKQGSGTRKVYMRIAAGNTGALVFDLIAGTASGPSGIFSSSSITPVGNGVYRCTGVWTATSATHTVVRIQLITNIGQTSYTGDGTSGIYIWGAQVEEGAFPTSYIPTTTAAATRSADVASITGSAFSSWYRQDEGTMFANATTNARHAGANTFPRIASLSDGTTSNRMDLLYRVLAPYTDARLQCCLQAMLRQAAFAYK
jgi:hypothetical protein